MPLGKTESSVHAAPNENPGGSISGVFAWLVVVFISGFIIGGDQKDAQKNTIISGKSPGVSAYILDFPTEIRYHFCRKVRLRT